MTSPSPALQGTSCTRGVLDEEKLRTRVCLPSNLRLCRQLGNVSRPSPSSGCSCSLSQHEGHLRATNQPINQPACLPVLKVFTHLRFIWSEHDNWGEERKDQRIYQGSCHKWRSYTPPSWSDHRCLGQSRSTDDQRCHRRVSAESVWSTTSAHPQRQNRLCWSQSCPRWCCRDTKLRLSFTLSGDSNLCLYHPDFISLHLCLSFIY